MQAINETPINRHQILPHDRTVASRSPSAFENNSSLVHGQRNSAASSAHRRPKRELTAHFPRLDLGEPDSDLIKIIAWKVFPAESHTAHRTKINNQKHFFENLANGLASPDQVLEAIRSGWFTPSQLSTVRDTIRQFALHGNLSSKKIADFVKDNPLFSNSDIGLLLQQGKLQFSDLSSEDQSRFDSLRPVELKREEWNGGFARIPISSDNLRKWQDGVQVKLNGAIMSDQLMAHIKDGGIMYLEKPNGRRSPRMFIATEAVTDARDPEQRGGTRGYFYEKGPNEWGPDRFHGDHETIIQTVLMVNE